MLLFQLISIKTFKSIIFWVRYFFKHLQPTSKIRLEIRNWYIKSPLHWSSVTTSLFTRSSHAVWFVTYRFVSHLQCETWASVAYLVFKHDQVSYWFTWQRNCGREIKIDIYMKETRGNYTQSLFKFNRINFYGKQDWKIYVLHFRVLQFNYYNSPSRTK